ncbi:MAG: isopeptide-forming domain-containing fimbrial protein [Lachnospiraceae bacterium]
MKKMKKLFAVILSLAMVLGMSLTAFAVDSATITVKDGAGTVLTEAALSYLQIIKPDQTTETGWAFSSKEIETKYLEGYNKGEAKQLDAQGVIRALIAARGDDGYANTANIGRALSAVAGMTDAFIGMSNPQTVNSAGVYAVKATQEGYTYNNMAAYVGFGTSVDGRYPTLTNAELTAKRSEVKLDKSHNDEDKVSAIGDIVEYTIKTNVPYIDPNKENKTYYIHDAIKGADYVLKDNNVEGHVTLAGEELTKIGEDDVVLVPNGPKTVIIGNNNVECEDSFYIDLSGLIDDQNSNADKEIVVTYKAKVTAETVDNKAQAGHKNGESYGGEFGEDDDKVFTGRITLTKTNEDGSEKLANAGFEVTTGDPAKRVYFTKNGDGDYTHIDEVDLPKGVKEELDKATADKKTAIDELEVTRGEGVAAVTYVSQVFTKNDGTVIVRGLNVGTYKFTEKTAPKGYSVNETPAEATLQITTEGEEANGTIENGVAIAQKILEDTTGMTDTKLSALPSTGGIGTTIFTIGGCAIMIVAAALFFASRRKSSAK